MTDASARIEGWQAAIKRLNDNLDFLYRDAHNPPLVRIAIISTGFAPERNVLFNDDVQLERARKHQHNLIAKPMSDDETVGTDVTTILMQTARLGEIFLLRVADRQVNLEEYVHQMAEAIRKASFEMDVDIICFHPRFDEPQEPIQKAIREAVNVKNHRIVFFAPVGDNPGSPEQFPASMEEVISVRSTDIRGRFMKFNPLPATQNSGPSFGALGNDMPIIRGPDARDDEVQGTDISTAVLAAGAAAIMQFAFVKSVDPRYSAWGLREVRDSRVLVEVLRTVSRDNDDQPPSFDVGAFLQLQLDSDKAVRLIRKASKDVAESSEKKSRRPKLWRV